MKKSLSVLIAIIFSSQLFAQAPNKMSYQAVIRNSSNNLVVSKSIGMQVSILQGSVTGTAVFVERQTSITNANGLASIEIGTGTIVSGSFTTINWANGPYFIKTETDLNGGTTYTISGTSELMSVPYALFAANSAPGPQGLQGPQGIQGIQGIKGDSGSRGLTGSQGIQGLQGIKGDTGIRGLTGLQGIQGIKGDSGARGLTGLQGIQGIQGIKGDTGIRGLTGPQGIKGDSGMRGLQGIQGPGLVHYIGEIFQGGIIVSVWKTLGVEHGLIVGMNDLSTGAVWSNAFTTAIGLTANSLHNGQTNTAAIVGQSGCSAGAAICCDTSTANGYSDWYLPSYYELNDCFNSAKIVNEILGSINGFQPQSYWSSTETFGQNNVTVKSFQNGFTSINYDKTLTPLRVRAVRKY